MDPFVIDEIIHHTLSICSYTRLIILSQLNLKYNKISKLFIDQYDKNLLATEFNIVYSDQIWSNYYLVKHLTILDRYHTIKGLIFSGNWKVITMPDKSDYIIYENGTYQRYCNSFNEFFNHYKILLSYLRKL